MAVYRAPALDKAAPIVDAQGRITPYFQRFWQNLSFTAADGANQSSDIAVLSAQMLTKVTKTPFLTTWSAATGTAERTTFATYTAASISNPPTQAQVQAIADHVQILSRRLKAMLDDIRA